jgi:iron complex outermembrane receptor protein
MQSSDRLVFSFPTLMALTALVLPGLLPAQDNGSAELDRTVVEAAEPAPRPVSRPAPRSQPAPVPVPAPEPVLVDIPVPEPLVFSDRAPVSLKIDAAIAETPRSVSVITQQQFQDRGALSLQDALNYTPGVTAGPFGMDTRGNWAFVRGVEPVTYVNGLRSLFGFYNNVRPQTYALDTLEVVKGPAGVLFGQGGVGGIINSTLKTAATFVENEVYATYGSFDRVETGMDLGGRDGDWAWRLVAVNREADTQVQFVPDDTWFVMPSVTWSPSEDTSLTFLVNLQEDESGTSAQFLPWQGTLLPGPRIPSGRFASEPGIDRYHTRQNAFTAMFEHRLNEVFSIEARANYTEGDADYRSLWPTFTGSGLNRIQPGGIVARDLYLSDATSAAVVYDLRLRAEFETGAVRHNASIGIDHQDARTDNDSYYGAGTPLNLYNPVYGTPQTAGPLFDAPFTDLVQTGLYLSDRIEVGNFVVSLGGRFDRVENSTEGVAAVQEDEAFTSDAGILYKVGNGLAPYFNFAESFLPASGFEVDANGNVLDPRRGEQFEAGMKYQPEGSDSLYTISFFEITESNRALPGPVPNTFVPSGELSIQGMELEAIHSFGDFYLQAGYTLLNTRDLSTPAELQLENVPEHELSAWLTWRPDGPTRGFKAGIGAHYTGASLDMTNTLETPEYAILDAMVGYEWENWDLTLNATNLTDEEYVASALSRGDVFFGQRRFLGMTLRRNF